MSESSVRSFEDLIAWQKSRALTHAVYQLTRTAQFREDRALVDQMRRASVSIMANIAEGYERRGTTEYVRFLTIAKSSAAELCSHLYVALDAGFTSAETHDRLLNDGHEVGRILGGLIRSLTAGSDGRPLAPPSRTSDLGPRSS